MKRARVAWATLILFLVAVAWNALLHLVVLARLNARIEPLRRPPAIWVMPLSLGLTAALVSIFVYGYLQVARRGTLSEGLRYGFCFGFLAGLLVDLNQFLLYPIPAAVALSWFLGGLAEFSLYGMLLSRLLPARNPSPSA